MTYVVSPWRRESMETIKRVLSGLPPDATDTQKRKAISDAYPFGPRQYHPYKIWLSEVRKYFTPPASRVSQSDIKRIEEYEKATGRKFPTGGEHGT